MRPASPGLIALLNSGTQFMMADLYTINTLYNGDLYYTNADTDLVYGGNTFQKAIISRSRTKLSVGLEVDTLDIAISVYPTEYMSGKSWIIEVRRGALDGADVKLEKIFMPTYGNTSLGAIILFQGRISDVDMSRTEAKIQVKSELDLLDTSIPKNFYQSGCLNTLYDDNCRASRTSASANGIVASGTLTQITTNTAGIINLAPLVYTLGTIQFTSGVNAGIKRTIREYSGNTFIMSSTLMELPLPGVAFTVTRGCDKTRGVCLNSFNNLANFRGFPFIPDPEAAI